MEQDLSHSTRSPALDSATHESHAHLKKSFGSDQKIIRAMEGDVPPSSKPGLVYIAKLVDHTPSNLIKIGRSSANPMRRIESQKCPSERCYSLQPAFCHFGARSCDVHIVEKLTHRVLSQWRTPAECNYCRTAHWGLKTETFAIEPAVASYTVAWIRAWIQTRPYGNNKRLRAYWREALESFDAYSDLDETPQQRSERWKTWIEDKERLRVSQEVVSSSPEHTIPMEIDGRAGSDSIPTDPENSMNTATSGLPKTSRHDIGRGTMPWPTHPSTQEKPRMIVPSKPERSVVQEYMIDHSWLTTSGAVTVFVISYVLAQLIQRLGIAMTFSTHMMLGLFSVRCSKYLVRLFSGYQHRVALLKRCESCPDLSRIC